MHSNNTSEETFRFTTVDYRYEVFTRSADGRQLEGDFAQRIAVAKNRGLIMLGQDSEAATVCVHDRMARRGRPKLWKYDGANWGVEETRAA